MTETLIEGSSRLHNLRSAMQNGKDIAGLAELDTKAAAKEARIATVAILFDKYIPERDRLDMLAAQERGIQHARRDRLQQRSTQAP